MTAADAEARPRLGKLTRIDGTEIPVRFEATTDPMCFRAVDSEGAPISVQPGDKLSVDVIGPGQSVKFGGPLA